MFVFEYVLKELELRPSALDTMVDSIAGTGPKIAGEAFTKILMKAGFSHDFDISEISYTINWRFRLDLVTQDACFLGVQFQSKRFQNFRKRC